jgi:nucleotide-binding universal stress UspA family protein
MAYKSILTVATNADHVARTMLAAAAISLDHDAYLDVLALGVDTVQVGNFNVGTSAGMLQLALEQVEITARAVEAAVCKAVTSAPPTLRWRVDAAVTQLGALTELVAHNARFADLVILPKPYGPHIGNEAEAVIEAALFEGQAPVLVLPDKGLGPLPIERVVIAWNQSREAIAATRHALPFLQAAKSVTVAVIEPPVNGAERADPGSTLCQMLVRHGVKAEILVLPRSLPRIADVLSQVVLDRNAGLLVMGAYGHSRFREAVMGGATRSMLEQMTVPVLMAH